MDVHGQRVINPFTQEREEMSTKCHHQCVLRLSSHVHAVLRLSFRSDVFHILNVLSVIKIMSSPNGKVLHYHTLMFAVKLGGPGGGERKRHPNSVETDVGFSRPGGLVAIKQRAPECYKD